MQFEFATASKILFGPGSLSKVGSQAATMGKRALVVTGLGSERTQPLLEVLQSAGLSSVLFQVSTEPTTEIVRQGTSMARDEACVLVIGFGGGSAVDTAKAIAALMMNPGDVLDYLEVIGKGKTLEQPSAACIAIPTTAGTGAEVTRNAVLSAPLPANPQQRVKVSLRSAYMLPRLALIDPELTYSLPPDVTAATGVDALTQLIEPFVSNRANPLTDAFCREGIPRAASSLLHAYLQGDDPQARQNMSLASLCGGLALANAKLGAVHGFAGPLGGLYPAPHGVICARLLPLVMDTNVQALHARQPDSPALERYALVAQMLTGKQQASPEDGVIWVQDLVEALHIPSLANYGLTEQDISTVVDQSAQASSMQGNPIQLTNDEMRQILIRSI